MFLLPGAERYRRVLLTGAVLALICLQAIWPWPWLEKAVQHGLGALQQPVAHLAGWVQQLVVGGPASELGPPPPKEESALIEAERKQGRPQPLPGMAWLEVPVRSVELERGRMVLAAGEDFHLASGQVVAFAQEYLGRLGKVEAHQSEVDLWSSSDMRTGLSVRGDHGFAMSAVCFGRGRGGRAVLNWVEDKTLLRVGMALQWRPRPLDPPTLAAAGLHMGFLEREGNEQRGDALWVVAHELPAASMGRVYVAAGAVGPKLVAEPRQEEASAQWVLGMDAVLGGAWFALSASSSFVPTVATFRGQVCGEVLVWRGAWGWAHSLSPADWAENAVALGPGGRVLPASDWQSQETDLPLFSRGGSSVPRGLWLGWRFQSAVAPGAEMKVLCLSLEPDSTP